MNRARTGLVLGIVSALGVLLLVMAGTDRKSPGPVSRVHAQLEEIDGGAACSACHGGWFGNMRSACNECHDEIAAQLTDRRGLHGSLAPAVATNCSTCHSEHHGDDFRLVNRLAFAQAGVADAARFDHRLVGWEMGGRHLALACTKCHANAEVDLLPEGEHRFLGLSKDCSTCHANPHGGRMQFGCATCHGQQDFAEKFVAEHDRVLPLHGGHAAVGCRECHEAGTEHALEALAPGAVSNPRQCGDCHESPHSQAFLAGNAAATGSTARASCAACHPLDFTKFTDTRVAVTAEQHAHGGFPLTAPHAGVACVLCHDPQRPYDKRHTGRKPNDCRQCHQDPHGGQFDEGPFGAAGCVGCHAPTHFAPHGFDLAHHARTEFPLEGKHAETGCAKCHLDPSEGQPRRFEGTQHRCEQCHQDAHRGAFAGGDAVLAQNPKGRCAQCHGFAKFAEMDHAAFDHARWTGFAVDGAHAQIDCTGCHVPSPVPDELGRKFGRITKHGGARASCVTCHEDPHDGQFDKAGVPSAVDGRTGCQRCHDTASFRALTHGFDHGAFAGFPLSGAHGKLDCSACHERLATPDANSRTWGRARGRECADCHRDPHAGQFARLGRIDCSRCHKSATKFATTSFRHNLDSRFPLGEAHAQVPCASCHKKEEIRGEKTVRYLPLPMECVDCHGNEGAPSKRRKQ